MKGRRGRWVLVLAVVCICMCRVRGCLGKNKRSYVTFFQKRKKNGHAAGTWQRNSMEINVGLIMVLRWSRSSDDDG